MQTCFHRERWRFSESPKALGMLLVEKIGIAKELRVRVRARVRLKVRIQHSYLR
jgi:hypothetical protein